jgi:hypothetical protein
LKEACQEMSDDQSVVESISRLIVGLQKEVRGKDESISELIKQVGEKEMTL